MSLGEGIYVESGYKRVSEKDQSDKDVYKIQIRIPQEHHDLLFGADNTFIYDYISLVDTSAVETVSKYGISPYGELFQCPVIAFGNKQINDFALDTEYDFENNVYILTLKDILAESATYVEHLNKSDEWNKCIINCGYTSHYQLVLKTHNSDDNLTEHYFDYNIQVNSYNNL